MITTESLARLLALCLLARLALSHSYSTILARMLVFHPAFHLVFLRSSPMMPDHSLVRSLALSSPRFLDGLLACSLVWSFVCLHIIRFICVYIPLTFFGLRKASPGWIMAFFLHFLHLF